MNVSSCRCELNKLAALIKSEACDVETDDKIKHIKNKTVHY